LPGEVPYHGAQTPFVTFGKPEALSVTAGGLRSADLSWSAPQSRVYCYRIERSCVAEGPFAFVADVSSSKLAYTDGAEEATRLLDSTAYYYRVSTVLDKSGTRSEPTPPVKTVTAPPPVPPLGVEAAATGSRAVTLRWQASAAEGVTSYRVERSLLQPVAFEPVATVKETSYVDGGTPASTLKDSSKYLYRIVAINRVGSEGAPSVTAEVLTLPPPKPVQKGAAVSKEVRCVPLTWEPSPEADVVYYDIYQARAAEGPFAKIGKVDGRMTVQFTDGGGNPGNLEDDGTYFYRIRAVNNVTSESADSETFCATTREVPPEVGQVVAIPARPREVPVSWALSTDAAVVGYEVWRSVADADDWSQVVRLNSRDVTSYLDRGGEKDGTKMGLLKDGTEYQYKVIAYNTANVRSSASAVVRVRTKVIPVQPAGVSATTNLAGLVRLTWQHNPEKDVNGYWVETSKKAAEGFRKLVVTRVAEGAPLVAEENELEPNVTKHYRIKALDKEGLESEWSEEVVGRSKPLPDAPTGLQAQPAGATVRITWQPSAQRDVTQYKVWSKKFLGWDLVATTEQPEYRVGLTELAKAMTVAVTAVDQDKLESEKSATVKVEPLLKP